MRVIADFDQFDTIVCRSGFLVVHCFPVWTSARKALDEQMVHLSKDFPGVKFIAVEGEAFQQITIDYEVSNFQTFLIFKNGVVVERVVSDYIDPLKDALATYYRL